jgi:hypothetical protein
VMILGLAIRGALDGVCLALVEQWQISITCGTERLSGFPKTSINRIQDSSSTHQAIGKRLLRCGCDGCFFGLEA